MNAYAYVRVSGKGQVDGDGFTRQSIAIAKHAESKQRTIVATFPERGITGTVIGRPAWSAMIGHAREQGVTVVIVEALNRLARELMVQETIIADLARNGIMLESATEADVMSTDPTRVMVRQMLGAVAQYDKSQIVAKLRGARQRIKERDGRCEGKKPYGEHPEYPEETDRLIRLYALRDTGGSFRLIADRLNAENIPTRHGGRWYAATIGNILGRRKFALGASSEG